MNLEIFSRDKNEAPGWYPGVYNTLVPFDNVTMCFSGSILKANDIMGMWRYVHNLFVESMHNANLVDRYGRMRCYRGPFIRGLYQIYWSGKSDSIATSQWDIMISRENVTSLAKDIVTSIMHDLSDESVEWMKIYPIMILAVPIVQIIRQVIHSSSILWFSELTRGMHCTFDLSMEYNEFHKLEIEYSVKDHRNQINIGMVNQYGNNVYLNIKSNTHKFDDFIDEVGTTMTGYTQEEADQYVKRFVFTFSRTGSLNRKRKLLLSMMAIPLDTESYEPPIFVF